MKFIPPEAEAVPGEALVSEHSRDLLAEAPDRFARARINTLLAGYQELIRRYRDA
ncbi:hypothetical protein [Dactylosporangium sp. CA-092794]|uniref:hypothetical protein n=1 Tax=Dactylosporangium sp. CA-092794 TaxID=3239929 RepID=UPI003D8C430D